MKKTLLLVFIHGFKGGDDTFATFPSYLRELVAHALPKISIVQVQYPKFDTRGDLQECVSRFKEWLQNKVIDLEVANGTPSPTVDPSVHVVLVGHSMGGIVAAETVLSIRQDQPVSTSGLLNESNTFMFPYIQGILAFDTPYLGIAPGVVAHGAQEQWNSVASVYGAYTSVASAFGLNAATPKGNEEAQKVSVEASKMITAGPSSVAKDGDAAAAPAWSRWGRYAMFAGAAGAVAAGGAAAYLKRDELSAGAKWMSSHLEFVGCLAKGQELQKRLANIIKLEENHNFAFANLYTCLGRAVEVEGKAPDWASGILGSERTFCVLPLPKSETRPYFYPMINDKATAETAAHMTMFTPRDNPGYYAMTEKAKELVAAWMANEWYEDADAKVEMENGSEDEAEMVERPSVETEHEHSDPETGFVDLKEGKNPWSS